MAGAAARCAEARGWVRGERGGCGCGCGCGFEFDLWVRVRPQVEGRGREHDRQLLPLGVRREQRRCERGALDASPAPVAEQVSRRAEGLLLAELSVAAGGLLAELAGAVRLGDERQQDGKAVHPVAPTVRGSTSVMVTTENRCQLVYAAAGKFLPLTDRNVSDAGSNYVAEPCIALWAANSHCLHPEASPRGSRPQNSDINWPFPLSDSQIACGANPGQLPTVLLCPVRLFSRQPFGQV